MQLNFWTEEPLATDGLEQEEACEPHIGRAGEYIVAAELELAGYPCSKAAEGLPYDLIAQLPTGLCRLQVKTCAAATAHHAKRLAYRYRNYRHALNDYPHVDVFAFVALDKRVATFVRASHLGTRGIEIAAVDFENPNLRALSLTQALGPLPAPASSE